MRVLYACYKNKMATPVAKRSQNRTVVFYYPVFLFFYYFIILFYYFIFWGEWECRILLPSILLYSALRDISEWLRELPLPPAVK